MAVTPPAEPLVGRTADLAAISELFRTEHRLVTLTGPAGVGKSRLATEVAVRFAGAGTPTWVAEIGEARGVSGICDGLTRALDLRADPGTEDSVGCLGRAIAGRGELLLMVDEFDGLVDHAEATVGRWLSLAPEALFLVTSRERLRLPGEAVHELGPLGLPEGDATVASEAVELFVRAARRVRGSFVLTAGEAPYVAAIVRELDGLPLAIELCAPRIAVMGARALLHRLGNRFAVLRRSDRTPPGPAHPTASGRGAVRHATLEAAIDSSFQALAPWDRDALAHCSVFRGGFTLEAAEAVIDVRQHAGAPPALDIVASLRDKSLLHAYEPRETPGELRLGVYASIREHAARTLDPEAARAAEARHADAIVGGTEAWARSSIGRGAPEARARILLERDNLLAVLDRVLARGPITARRAEPALRALLVLAPVLVDERPLDAYVQLLDPVLAATTDSGADPRLHAHALAVRGAVMRRRGQGLVGNRDLVHALSAATRLRDRHLEARVTIELGYALEGRGETALAEEHFERALRLHQELGDRVGVGDALHGLGSLIAKHGRIGEAISMAERALSVHRVEGCPIAEAADLRLLGEILLDGGRIDTARAFLREGQTRSGELGDRRGEALAAGLLALADDLAGELPLARAGYDRACAALRDLGLAPLEATFLGRTGVLCLREGRMAEAYALLGTASDRVGNEGQPVRTGVILAYKAALAAHVGREAEARRELEDASLRISRGGGPHASAVLELARGMLDPTAVEAARAAARSVAPHSAEVRLALACFERMAAEGARGAPPPPDDALLIGPQARWFRPPQGERVALEHRRPLARILDRLTRERLDKPGAALPWDVLLETGWPGERVIASAGAHRVRVALSTLRKLGLKEMLRTTTEGYALGEEIPVLQVN